MHANPDEKMRGVMWNLDSARNLDSDPNTENKKILYIFEIDFLTLLYMKHKAVHYVNFWLYFV